MFIDLLFIILGASYDTLFKRLYLYTPVSLQPILHVGMSQVIPWYPLKHKHSNGRLTQRPYSHALLLIHSEQFVPVHPG